MKRYSKDIIVYNLKVSKNDAGIRLDVFISHAIDSMTRSRAKALISQGFVTIRGTAVKAARSLSVGDIVNVRTPQLSPSSITAENIPLNVIYEDDDIIVVNKPSGMVVHPAVGHRSGTLVNALLGHCHDLSGIGGEMRAGIVHRLDKGTSGVIISAKNDSAHLSLSSQFKERSVSKHYLALVFGVMNKTLGNIDLPIGRANSDRKKFSSYTSRPRSARTEWRVLERFDSVASWLDVTLHTGRTHQIRVHFSESGHAIVGDSLYGGGPRRISRLHVPYSDIFSKIKRPALHAWRTEISHPSNGRRLLFEAPLPEDLEKLLSELKSIERE